MSQVTKNMEDMSSLSVYESMMRVFCQMKVTVTSKKTNTRTLRQEQNVSNILITL